MEESVLGYHLADPDCPASEKRMREAYCHLCGIELVQDGNIIQTNNGTPEKVTGEFPLQASVFPSAQPTPSL